MTSGSRGGSAPPESGPSARSHPLAAVIRAAASGHFPPVDGVVERLPTWRSGLEAAVAFTGHGYLCLDDDRALPDTVDDLAQDAFGGVTDPRVVAGLAGPVARPDDIDSLDVLLVATGSPAPAPPGMLVARPDLENLPRVGFARRKRNGVRVLGLPFGSGSSAVLVLSRGVAGLAEVSVEVPEPERGQGVARDLVASARGLVGDDVVVAMVSPGNAASLRAFLAAGFAPIGSAQLWHREQQKAIGTDLSDDAITRGRVRR